RVIGRIEGGVGRLLYVVFHVGTFHFLYVVFHVGTFHFSGHCFGLISTQPKRARRGSSYGDAKPIIKVMVRLMEPKFLLISLLFSRAFSNLNLGIRSNQSAL